MVQHGGSGQAAASRFIRTYLLTMDEVKVGLTTASERQKQNRKPKEREEILTTVVHAVQPGDVYSTEVLPLANYLIKVRYGGGDSGNALILVEGQWSVVHDGLIIIRRVQISDIVVLILIEIVLHPCVERVTLC